MTGLPNGQNRLTGSYLFYKSFHDIIKPKAMGAETQSGGKLEKKGGGGMSRVKFTARVEDLDVT